MFKKAGILFFYTITPLHPGSGASVGAVDLPVQRERYTNFPIVQASGVKGALRDVAEKLWADKKEEIKVVFGPETEKASDYGGALAFTDARLLLFPVRSARGIFAWITCKAAIERLKRDISIIPGSMEKDVFTQIQEIELPKVERGKAVVPSKNVALGDKIVLEEFVFSLSDEGRDKVKNLASWLANNAFPLNLGFWQKKLKEDHDLVLLSDDDFRHFVEMSTELITRVQLGETGTVAAGPWDEEHLPCETLLYSLALATNPKKEQNTTSITDANKVIEFLSELLEKVQVAQFGGDETVGKGLVLLRFVEGGEGYAGDRLQNIRAEARS
jgi:CRISPR-associated protein Cmr4